MGNMPTIVRGDNAPQLQEIVYDFDPQRGWNVISQYEGASQLYMESLAKQYAAAKIACRLTYRKDMATLEAHDATQQYTLDVWQILGNEESRDIFSHPTVISICTDDQIASIRYFINNINNTAPIAGQIAQFFAGTFTGVIWPSPTLSPVNQGIMATFIGLYLRGTTEYRRQQYVLRHTTNCPNSWPANNSASWPGNVAASNIECIYSTSKLLAEVTSTASWILPLPYEMQVTIQNVPAPNVFSDGKGGFTIPAGYAWGWLKGASTTSSAANNRVDISTEYTLELWSTNLYQYIG